MHEKPNSGYDIIGDVHGHAEMLKALLKELGYRHGSGTWRHDGGRKAIFVGDLIDRGPEQMETVEIVRRMVDQDVALCIMGNHEYNAIQHRLGLRKLNETDPHHTFLAQVKADRVPYRACLDWFMTLPLWLDMGNFGVVHACWDTCSMDVVKTLGLGPDCTIPEKLHRLAASGKPDKEKPDSGKPEDADDRRAYRALENILKGPELRLPDGFSFTDKDHKERHEIRTRWYKDDAKTYRDLAFMSEQDAANIPDLPVPEDLVSMVPDKPVFIGHYWQDKAAEKKRLSDKVVCVDYSAGIDGPLVAYRWNKGDTALLESRFVHVGR